MPSGRNHDRITLWLLPGIVAISLLVSRSGELTLIVASGFLFSGLMFGPDLDIYSIEYKRWGIFRWIWLPYQSTIPHRSWLSHGWIIGTVIRLSYLLSLLLLLGIVTVGILQLISGIDWNWQQFTKQSLQLITEKYPQETIALLLGLELGSTSHSISDWIGSTRKRLKRKTKERKR